MTAFRNDGMKKAKGKMPLKDVMNIYKETWAKTLPEMGMLFVIDFWQDAVVNLYHYIALGENGISWKSPRVRLIYDAPDAIAALDKTELPDAALSADEAKDLLQKLFNSLPDTLEKTIFQVLTRGVILEEVALKNVSPFSNFFPGKKEGFNVRIPTDSEVTKEIEALPEAERNAKLEELAAGYDFGDLPVSGTVDTPEGKQPFRVSLKSKLSPLIWNPKTNRLYYKILIGLDITEGDPSTWSEENQKKLINGFLKGLQKQAAPYLEKLKKKKEQRLTIPKPGQVQAVRSEDFAVAGGYARPIFGLSKDKQDFQLLLQYHEPQTPLNWAVGLSLFALTDEDKIRSGDWQEARIKDLEDRIFCLTEQNAPRHGQHREDLLTEVVKLHTTRNWYYEINLVKVGRAWKKQAVIGSQYAMPELQLVYLDKNTGKRVFPTDATFRAMRIPLEIKGRRIIKPDGRDIPALPKSRWQLEAIRWRWVQAFNDDLLLAPALEEKGKWKGLPMKAASGKIIRRGYLIRVAENIFAVLQKLRKEGSGSLYAWRLLVMLINNLHKTEEGIAADRVFRMLGIPEDYKEKRHKNPEDLVAAAVKRLKQDDVKALLPKSDEYPYKDKNFNRRKNPCYRFIRADNFSPRTGIASKADAEAIEAEYAGDTPTTPPATLPKPQVEQTALPGLESTVLPPIPSGAEIRAAREAAGVNLRQFAERMGGPSFGTWSQYENGKPVRLTHITPETWQKVREFVAQHGRKSGNGKGD